jgi:hypothetical protein
LARAAQVSGVRSQGEGEGPPQAIALGHFKKADELSVAAFISNSGTLMNGKTTLWTATTTSGDFIDALSLVSNSQGSVTLATTRRKPQAAVAGLDELIVVNGKALQRSTDSGFATLAELDAVPASGSRLLRLDLNLDGIDDIALERPGIDILYVLGTSVGDFEQARSIAGMKLLAPGSGVSSVLASDGKEFFNVTVQNRELEFVRIESVTAKNATSIARGDLNGDGIDDLAVIDQAALRVFYGEENVP